MSPEPPEETWDLFISYPHADDRDGWIAELVQVLQQIHNRYTPKPWRVFFDRRAILPMEDWEQTIDEGLRQSGVMLAFLSPAYFTSDYCQKEWRIFREQEVHRGPPEKDIALLYLHSTALFDQDDIDEARRPWRDDLRRRQYLDARSWRQQGREALYDKQGDIYLRLEEWERKISDHLADRRRQRKQTTSVSSLLPERNPQFVGRTEELRWLRDTLQSGQSAALTAVFGLGGMGKSALAFEYAHRHAADYPGGAISGSGVHRDRSAFALARIGRAQGRDVER